MRKDKRKPRLGIAGAIAIAAAIAMLASRNGFALDESPAGGSTSGGAATEAPPPPPPESMSVVPEGEASPAESGVTAKPTHKRTHRTSSAKSPGKPVEVEPAQARLKVSRDDWIFSAPSKWSKHIMRAHAGKYVNVTGTTRYYLQVKLKEGPTGYISPSAVELLKPVDKIFQLTHDAGVLEEPNRWSKKVAGVHRGHNVQVIGVALNYMKIRMKNGTEGFIPVSALE